MKKNRISRECLLAKLRNQSITNLSRVKRCYLETSGSFSNLLFKEPQTGLTLIPKADEDFLNEQKRIKDVYACASCGILTQKPEEAEENCPVCNHYEWTDAVYN